MATSTIPALKASLLALLTAGLSDVQVSWGWPGGAPAHELVVLGDVHEWTQEQAAQRAGRKPRDEDYLLEIYVRVERNGTQQRPATERVFAIAAEIEDVVGDDWSITGAVDGGEFAGGDLEEMAAATGDGRTALLTLRVRCNARLTV